MKVEDLASVQREADDASAFAGSIIGYRMFFRVDERCGAGPERLFDSHNSAVYGAHGGSSTRHSCRFRSGEAPEDQGVVECPQRDAPTST